MRGNDTLERHFARVPMFSACTKRQLRRLARLATEIDVPSGRQLTTEGEPGHEFVIVLDGVASVEIGGHLVSTVGQGDWFGEIALLDGGPRTATVRAQTPMTIAVVGRREFATLLDEAPGLTRAVLTGMARRLRATDAGRVVGTAA